MPYNEPQAGDARRGMPTPTQVVRAHHLRHRGHAWRVIAQLLGVDAAALIAAHHAAYPHARMSLTAPPAEEDLSDG